MRVRPAAVFGPVDSPPWKRHLRLPGSTLTACDESHQHFREWVFPVLIPLRRSPAPVKDAPKTTPLFDGLLCEDPRSVHAVAFALRPAAARPMKAADCPDAEENLFQWAVDERCLRPRLRPPCPQCAI